MLSTHYTYIFVKESMFNENLPDSILQSECQCFLQKKKKIKLKIIFTLEANKINQLCVCILCIIVVKRFNIL